MLHSIYKNAFYNVYVYMKNADGTQHLILCIILFNILT